MRSVKAGRSSSVSTWLGTSKACNWVMKGIKIYKKLSPRQHSPCEVGDPYAVIVRDVLEDLLGPGDDVAVHQAEEIDKLVVEDEVMLKDKDSAKASQTEIDVKNSDDARDSFADMKDLDLYSVNRRGPRSTNNNINDVPKDTTEEILEDEADLEQDDIEDIADGLDGFMAKGYNKACELFNKHSKKDLTNHIIKDYARPANLVKGESCCSFLKEIAQNMKCQLN